MTEREKLVPFLLFLLQEAYYVVFPTSFFLFYQNNVHMLPANIAAEREKDFIQSFYDEFIEYYLEFV